MSARRAFSEIRERLRALLFRGREEAELDEELRFHVEMAAEEKVRRGMHPAEARRRALLELGGIEQTKEDVHRARGIHTFENLLRDVRHGLRRLRGELGFSVPMVVTIGLGIGVATAAFALVNAVLLRPLPYPDADRLVELRHAAPGAELTVSGLSPGTFLHYREHNRAFEDVGVYMEDVRALTDAGAPEQARVAVVSPSLFTVLAAAPQRGRLPAASSDSGERGGVVISHDLWVRRYGADSGIVGRAIEIDRRPHVVSGVAQPGFRFPHRETDIWMTRQMEDLLDRFGQAAALQGLYLKAVARLAPGVSTAEAERDLDRLVRRLPAAFPDVTQAQLEEMGIRAVVAPLKDSVVGEVRPALLLLLAAAGFLLLMTWANATNLCLARSERQRREIRVQRALGASEGRLASRFLSESALIVALAGALGLAVAYLAVELRFGFEPGQIPRLDAVALDGAGVGVAVGASFLTGLLLAAVSLLGTRRQEQAGQLTTRLGGLAAGRREQTGRRVLVAGQVALALVLLMGSALMARSYWGLAQVELGFEPEGALTFLLPLPPPEYPDYSASARVHQDIRERIGALPGVEAVEAATVSVFPLTPVPDYYLGRARVADAPAADTSAGPQVIFGRATRGYFQAMGLRLIRGQRFEDVTGTGIPQVIISASLARALFGTDDPVGRRVRLDGPGVSQYSVAGVVGGVPSRTLRDGPAHAAYLPHVPPMEPGTDVGGIVPRNEQYVVRTSVPPTSLVPAIRRSIQEVDPKLVMTRIGTLEDLVTESMARTRLTMLLLSIGTGTALFLGLIGIYGVLSYTVRRRTAELAVRIALGASPSRVVRMVVGQAALLALGGIVVGLVAAFALTRFLDSVLYEVSPTDPVAFTLVPVLLFAVALVAGYLPARRAGRIDPAGALRPE